MHTLVSVLLLAAAAGLPARPAAAQALVFSADPPPLVVSTATAGAAPDPVSAAGMYSLEGITAPSRITARLDAPLPPGVTLRVTLSAPPGAQSAGAAVLSETETELLRDIPPGSWTGLSVRYDLSATAAAGTIPLSAPSVTFTLRSGT